VAGSDAADDTTLAELIAPLGVDADAASGYRVTSIDEENGRLRLHTSDGAELVVQVDALDASQPSFATTRSFAISYLGTSGLSKNAESALRALIAAVARNDVGRPLRRPRTAHEPTAAERAGRSRVLGAKEVDEFYLVHYEYEDAALEGTPPPTSRLGILYRCNQDCVFCQLAYMNVDLPREKIFAAIDESRSRGSIRLIITGGEPTLSKNLFDYVSYARERGFEIVELQTNAVAAHSARYADKLVAAGLTNAQVSLHGPDAQISDRLTAGPGTHAKTVEGIGNLLERGVTVLLNHLIFADNHALLPDFATLVETRWSAYKQRLVIQFHAPLNEFEQRELALQHIARYTDYAPTLLQTWDRLDRQNYHVRDLQDPTGLPALCLLGADERYLGPIARQEQHPRFHRWERGWLTHVTECEQCDARAHCMGIPKHYLELHGDAEFRAIKLDDTSDCR